MKKTKKPSGKTCTSAVMGGALVCVLQGEHDTHSTATPGRKSKQHATWASGEDGRILVTTFSGGKKMSEWFADGELVHPPAPGASTCGQRWERTADGAKLEKKRQIACGRKVGHEGLHRAYALEGNHVSEWIEDGSRGGCHIPKEHFEGRTLEESPANGATAVAEIDDDEPDEIEMRSLARQQREAREAHAAEIETAPKAPSLTDACTKCGRELGEHDGKKCPKKEKAEVSIGTFPITPVTPGDDRLSTDPRILGYRRHPAAKLFELLEGEELQGLADSIQKNGQRDAIVLVTVGGETYILDGSNRGVACELRGIKPRTVNYEGPKDMASLINYSMDKNRHRRHQEPSVLAMVAVDAAQLGRGNPGSRETGRSAGLMTQAEAGKRLGVSERLVRRAKVVRDKGTAKVNEAVRKGRLAVEAAEQLTKLSPSKQDEIADEALAKKGNAVKSGRIRSLVKQEEKRATVRTINEQRVEPAPLGPFGVISIDPPWPYENSDQHEGSRGHIDYPPMSIDEICALGPDLHRRAKDDCILGMWVTNAFIHEVGRILAAWGFTHRTMITWDKELAGVGTLPRGQTEHLVIAMRGAPVHTLNEVTTMLRITRREHSRKPDEMYELLAKHCSGPMIDMFSREEREGWATWGAETDKFATEAA